MRRYAANDRIVSNELTAATVDAPERETYVESDTNPTNPATLEVGCDAGTVVINGSTVSVSAQSESVPDLTGSVTETAYAYHTLSIDNTGALVVRTSDTGEFDASSPDDPPITQVTEPSHAAGECYIGTAFQVEGAIERVFDGRYQSRTSVPTGGIIMWSGAVADVPAGWTLCDGTDGTPDLRDRFIVGAGGSYSVDETGGEAEHTLTESEMPSHTHDYEGGNDGRGVSEGGFSNNQGFTTKTSQSAGGDVAHENRPPYYALAFIMKV